MKRLLIGLVGMGVLFWVTPALATVTVFAEIFKTKDINIEETIFIDKQVFLFADVFIDVEKAAESLAIANQDNFQNEACTNCDEKLDLVNDSFNLNDGVVDGNQAAGNMNNQGNAVSVAVDTRVGSPPVDQLDPLDGQGFAESQAHAEQVNEANFVDTINLLFRDAAILDSFSGNTGVLGFNQSPGNMNNQVNLVSLAVALTDSGVALSEADLGQFNLFNIVEESDSIGDPGGVGINKSASILASLNNNTGIVGLNQSAGNMANQANVVSMSFVSAAQ
jgi:hypothetical protein